MNGNQQAKDLGAARKEAKAVGAADGSDELEPCDSPQAQEASRFTAVDEACDDGVN